MLKSISNVGTVLQSINKLKCNLRYNVIFCLKVIELKIPTSWCRLQVDKHETKTTQTNPSRTPLCKLKQQKHISIIKTIVLLGLFFLFFVYT